MAAAPEQGFGFQGQPLALGSTRVFRALWKAGDRTEKSVAGGQVLIIIFIGITTITIPSQH